MEGKDYPCPLLRGCGLLKEPRILQEFHSNKTLSPALDRQAEISQDGFPGISVIKCNLLTSRVPFDPDENDDELLGSTPLKLVHL